MKRKKNGFFAAVRRIFSADDCELNEIQTVYGPPPEKAEQSETVAEFVPSRNEIRCVYGPPEYFRKRREEAQQTTVEAEVQQTTIETEAQQTIIETEVQDEDI